MNGLSLHKYTPTAKSYFSGCGGMDIGMMRAGINIIQSLDLDKKATDCMKLNKHYFSHTILTADIKDMTVLNQPKADIMLFTYPCTKYSTIADIHGTRTGDELFLHALRHIVIEQPEMFVVENVPGMRKFKVVMEAMTKIPGYHLNQFCPVDAANWLPQRRERLILIATRKRISIQAPAAPKIKPSIKSIVQRHARVSLPPCALKRLNGGYRDKPIIVDPAKGEIAPTCIAHYAKDLGTRLLKDKKAPHGVRPFSIREYARLQGFPDDFKFIDAVNSYKLIGNAVAVDMAEWIGNEAIKYFN